MSTTLFTKRAAGYIRVSGTGQIGERHSSLETQETRYREYCEFNQCTPMITFLDVVSGNRDDRREYIGIIEYVRAGKADVPPVRSPLPLQ